MDWFSRWPKDALIAVSSHFLGQYNIVSEDETKRQLIEMMGTVHDGVAENCITYFQRSDSLTAGGRSSTQGRLRPSGGARVLAARGRGPWCRPSNRQRPSTVH